MDIERDLDLDFDRDECLEPATETDLDRERDCERDRDRECDLASETDLDRDFDFDLDFERDPERDLERDAFELERDRERDLDDLELDLDRERELFLEVGDCDPFRDPDMDLDFDLETDFLDPDLDRDLDLDPCLEPDGVLDLGDTLASGDGDLDSDPFRDIAGDCLLDPEFDLDRDRLLCFPSGERVKDCPLLCELGELCLDLFIDGDFDRDCFGDVSIRDGEWFSSGDGERDVFFSLKPGVGDLLCDFRAELFEGERDFCEFDRERASTTFFGDLEGEREFVRERVGDLEQDREFTFGDDGLLRLADVDLDLDRECSGDPIELFLDSSKEELLDLDCNLVFAEYDNNRDLFPVTFSSTSGVGDLEGDFETLFLPADLELDLDLDFRFVMVGEADPFLEGECEGDLEYDFLELSLEATEAGDPACTGDE